MTAKRIAILGLMLESNSFAPITTKKDFFDRLYLVGDEIFDELNRADSKLPAEVVGFSNFMDDNNEWTPIPILMGLVEAGGPMEHSFFQSSITEMKSRLEAAMPLDGVYISNHGAMITSENRDPDGVIFEMIRDIVGSDTPIVATLDLHGNVSEKMVECVDSVVAYQTNPHVDMLARGAEAAEIMLSMFNGTRPVMSFIRLPIIPPTVTLLTEAGPYADLINFGQMRKSQIGPEIVNVSILGGFAYSDTPKNGLAIIVTAKKDKQIAVSLAREIASKAWKEHGRYMPHLTSLDDAVRMSVLAGSDFSKPALIFADVADNPGGGGNGNTTWILEALYQAGAKGVVIGTFNDSALAAEAHQLGVGAKFMAQFNRGGGDEFSKPFAAEATVVSLRDGDCVGRRGFYANRRMNLGPTALLDLGGIQIVVISIRTQCADPVFLEMMGIDIAESRTVVVKSRGHFRAGFDEFFSPDQVIEVDTAGLSSPILSRFDFKQLPRPAFPIDIDFSWNLSDEQ